MNLIATKRINIEESSTTAAFFTHARLCMACERILLRKISAKEKLCYIAVDIDSEMKEASESSDKEKRAPRWQHVHFRVASTTRLSNPNSLVENLTLCQIDPIVPDKVRVVSVLCPCCVRVVFIES